MDNSKISIGTAQFIDNYSLDQKGQLNFKNFSKIIDMCNAKGIYKLDTAQVYSNSENIIGNFDLRDWHITSKLMKIPETEDIEKFIFENVEKSLKNIRLDKIDILLLHSPDQLFLDYGEKIYLALLKLIQQSKIKKFGYSVYDPSQFINLQNKYKCSACQIPFNVFDQRILNNEFIETININKIHLQVRSIFLQGLLLLKQNELNDYFNQWKNHFDIYENYLLENDINKISLCLNFVFSNNLVSDVIVGIKNQKQLKEILEIDLLEITRPEVLRNNDIRLIEPFRWEIK